MGNRVTQGYASTGKGYPKAHPEEEKRLFNFNMTQIGAWYYQKNHYLANIPRCIPQCDRLFEGDAQRVYSTGNSTAQERRNEAQTPRHQGTDTCYLLSSVSSEYKQVCVPHRQRHQQCQAAPRS
jgi:hypothetical protein